MQEQFIHIMPRKEAKSLGLKYYFNGKPCPHGHFSYRFTSSHCCVECKRLESSTEKAKSYNVSYQKINSERLRIYGSEYREENRDSASRRAREWYSKNTERAMAHSRNRRAVLLSAEGSHAASDIRAILEKQRCMCANCKARLVKSGVKDYHVDHIQPLSRGGSNWPSNLQLLCPGCNLRKHAKDPFEWANENNRLL